MLGSVVYMCVRKRERFDDAWRLIDFVIHQLKKMDLHADTEDKMSRFKNRKKVSPQVQNVLAFTIVRCEVEVVGVAGTAASIIKLFLSSPVFFSPLAVFLVISDTIISNALKSKLNWSLTLTIPTLVS